MVPIYLTLYVDKFQVTQEMQFKVCNFFLTWTDMAGLVSLPKYVETSNSCFSIMKSCITMKCIPCKDLNDIFTWLTFYVDKMKNHLETSVLSGFPQFCQWPYFSLFSLLLVYATIPGEQQTVELHNGLISWAPQGSPLSILTICMLIVTGYSSLLGQEDGEIYQLWLVHTIASTGLGYISFDVNKVFFVFFM